MSNMHNMQHINSIQNPSELFKDCFSNALHEHFEWFERTLNFLFIDCFIFMAGILSPKRKTRISDDL